MTLERAVTDYQAKTPRSRQLFEEALRVMPGGNSRTTTFFDPYPFYITRGQGPRIWDADGAERLDFNGNYTSLILGHAHPSVVEAVAEQATRGMSFPGRSELAKFEGAYHGTHDWVLVSVSPDPAKAGSRKRLKPVAYSAGVPDAV